MFRRLPLDRRVVRLGPHGPVLAIPRPEDLNYDLPSDGLGLGSFPIRFAVPPGVGPVPAGTRLLLYERQSRFVTVGAYEVAVVTAAREGPGARLWVRPPGAPGMRADLVVPDEFRAFVDDNPFEAVGYAMVADWWRERDRLTQALWAELAVAVLTAPGCDPALVELPVGWGPETWNLWS